MTIYLSVAKEVINSYGDYEILGINRIIKIPEVEPLMHKLIYNEKDTVADKIKYIKNVDIALKDIIEMEKTTYQLYSFALFDKVSHNEFTFEKNGYSLEATAGMVLNTLLLIKIIKYGLCKADIAGFNEQGKLKKVFGNYKMIAAQPSNYTLIKAFQKNEIDYESLKMLVKEAPIDDVEYAIFCALYANVFTYENSRDYEKYLLGSEYNELITNPFKGTNINLMSHSIKTKTLTKRKVLVPKGGVVLQIEDNDDIDAILIREIEKENRNNILIIIRYKDGKELVNTIILQSNERHMVTYLEKLHPSTISLAYVYDFLGIEDELSTSSNLKYSVISPYYWKYRFSYSSPEDKKDSTGKVINRVHKVEIASFIRKSKGGASESAKQLAKRLCVELEEGYTIVKAHTRRYGASLDNK